MERSATIKGLGAAQDPAYNALQRMFSDNEDNVVEIEILPSSFVFPEGQLFVQESLSVGIPKKVLVAAFLRAREVFSARSTKLGEKSYDDARRATPIMLLFDPEHLTAANFRKRHLQQVSKEEDFEVTLQRELNFLDSVLSSPLHRQSKSPTLWYHRYWLISTFLLHIIPLKSREVLLGEEIRLVTVSGERHKKNYYAWQYARRLIGLLSSTDIEVAGTQVKIAETVVEQIMSWCLVHPSDISGWSFLLFLLQQPGQRQQQSILVVQKVAQFASSVRWSKEALWHFLRTVLLMTDILPQKDRLRLIGSTGVKAIGSSSRPEFTATDRVERHLG